MTTNSNYKKYLSAVVSLCLLLILLIPSYGFGAVSRVAVLPWKVNSAENLDFVRNAMMDMLSSRLGANPSIEVIRPDAVKNALGGSTEITDKIAIEAGKKLKADYVLYGSLTVLGTAVSMDSKLLKVSDGTVTPLYSNGTGLDSVVGMADKLSSDVLIAAGAVASAVKPAIPQAPAGAEIKQTLPPSGGEKTEGEKKPTEEGFIVKQAPEKKPVMWKSAKLDGMYISLAAADLNRDGVKELFILRKKSLIVARMKDDGLETVKEIGSGEADFVDLSAIDSDGDGVPEVYISAVMNGRAYSSVLEYKNNDYRVTITGVKWLLKTVSIGKKEPVLVGQAFRKSDGFYGELRILKKEGAEVVDKGPFEIVLPRKVDLYRFDAFDATNSNALSLVALDSRDYLNIYKKDEKGNWDKDWTSSEYYGGTLNYIEVSEDASSEKPPVPVEGRFYHSVTKEGKTELIIRKNNPGGLGRHAERAGSFVSGEVASLSWDGALLTENWKTKQVTGYIADFFIDDLKGDGSKEIVLLVVEGTEKLMGTPKSYVLSYRLSI